jgi:hypothetical protein
MKSVPGRLNAPGVGDADVGCCGSFATLDWRDPRYT